MIKASFSLVKDLIIIFAALFSFLAWAGGIIDIPRKVQTLEVGAVNLNSRVTNVEAKDARRDVESAEIKKDIKFLVETVTEMKSLLKPRGVAQ
jgi:hypothetical protein